MSRLPLPFDAISYQLDSSQHTLSQGSVGPFVQVLDESMVVIREDITDWLQRYLFHECSAPPLNDAKDLLERLKSGIWLARLAYKIHFKVIAASNPATAIPPSGRPKRGAGLKVTSKDHRLYASLRGSGPSGALGNLTADTLPPFRRPLRTAAEAPIGCREKRTEFIDPLDVTDKIATQWTARDNISAFLEWCHDLGISATVLFETTGLVNRTEEKNVLLTLMDLARLASRYGLCDLPELVKMEREIEVLEARRLHIPVLENKNEIKINPVSSQHGSNLRMNKEQPQVDPQEYAIRVANRKKSVVEGENDNEEEDDVTDDSSVMSSAITLGDVNSEVLDNDVDWQQPMNKTDVSINLKKTRISPDSTFEQITAASSKNEQAFSIDQVNNSKMSACGDGYSMDSSFSFSLDNRNTNKPLTASGDFDRIRDKSTEICVNQVFLHISSTTTTTPTVYNAATEAQAGEQQKDVSSISTCMSEKSASKSCWDSSTGEIIIESTTIALNRSPLRSSTGVNVNDMNETYFSDRTNLVTDSSTGEILIASTTTALNRSPLRSSTGVNVNDINETYFSERTKLVTDSGEKQSKEIGSEKSVGNYNTGRKVDLKIASSESAACQSARTVSNGSSTKYGYTFESETNNATTAINHDASNGEFELDGTVKSELTAASYETSPWLSTRNSSHDKDQQSDDNHITYVTSDFSEISNININRSSRPTSRKLEPLSSNNINELRISPVTSLSKSSGNTFSEDTFVPYSARNSANFGRISNPAEVTGFSNNTEVTVDMEGSSFSQEGKENSSKIESCNRFGWQNKKRTNSVVDLRAQVDPWRSSVRRKIDGDLSSDSPPQYPLTRSRSQTNLTPHNKGCSSSIPVSNILKQRARSQSKPRAIRNGGQLHQPPQRLNQNSCQSKNSSGFASRSSSYSDVHIEDMRPILKCYIFKLLEEVGQSHPLVVVQLASNMIKAPRGLVRVRLTTHPGVHPPPLLRKQKLLKPCIPPRSRFVKAMVAEWPPSRNLHHQPHYVCQLQNQIQAPPKPCMQPSLFKLSVSQIPSRPQMPPPKPHAPDRAFSFQMTEYDEFLPDELVRKHVAQCTCCNRIKLQRLDEGRYQLGSRIYYLRRFRSHIMVRVGGGWLTLSQFLERYDPCRQKQGQLTQTSALQDGLMVPAANLLESWPSEGPNEMFYAPRVHKGPCR